MRPLTARITHNCAGFCNGPGRIRTYDQPIISEAARASYGTDWHLARDRLGQEVQDPNPVTGPSWRMSHSRIQPPSTVHREIAAQASDPTP
jgi:hypothetical protein